MSNPILVEWRVEKLSTGLYALKHVGDTDALRTWTRYPTEEEIEAALAMARSLRWG